MNRRRFLLSAAASMLIPSAARKPTPDVWDVLKRCPSFRTGLRPCGYGKVINVVNVSGTRLEAGRVVRWGKDVAPA